MPSHFASCAIGVDKSELLKSHTGLHSDLGFSYHSPIKGLRFFGAMAESRIGAVIDRVSLKHLAVPENKKCFKQTSK